MPMYVYACIHVWNPYSYFSVSSSVIDAQTVVTPEDTTNRTYLFTVTCIIHADSIANECIVTATPDDQSIMSRTGNEFNLIYVHLCNYVVIAVRVSMVYSHVLHACFEFVCSKFIKSKHLLIRRCQNCKFVAREMFV